MEQNNRLAPSLNDRDPHFGLFWGFGLLLGYLATSSAKSDITFLLGDPISYKGDEIFRLYHLFLTSDMAQTDRETHDRCTEC